MKNFVVVRFGWFLRILQGFARTLLLKPRGMSLPRFSSGHPSLPALLGIDHLPKGGEMQGSIQPRSVAKPQNTENSSQPGPDG